MGTPHHGDPMQSQLLKQLREESRLREKLADQINQKAKREWPKGRAGGDDEGELAYMIAADPKHGIVRLEFGKPVDWLGLPPEEAVELAQALIKHARSIAKEPLRISLY